jgi:hypothetical protein
MPTARRAAALLPLLLLLLLTQLGWARISDSSELSWTPVVSGAAAPAVAQAPATRVLEAGEASAGAVVGEAVAPAPAESTTDDTESSAATLPGVEPAVSVVVQPEAAAVIEAPAMVTLEAPPRAVSAAVASPVATLTPSAAAVLPLRPNALAVEAGETAVGGAEVAVPATGAGRGLGPVTAAGDVHTAALLWPGAPADLQAAVAVVPALLSPPPAVVSARVVAAGASSALVSPAPPLLPALESTAAEVMAQTLLTVPATGGLSAAAHPPPRGTVFGVQTLASAGKSGLAAGPASDTAFQLEADSLAADEEASGVTVGAVSTAGAQNKKTSTGQKKSKAPRTAAQQRSRAERKRGKSHAASRKTREGAAPPGESLLKQTSGMCHYIDHSPWTDFFQELNTTRWDPRSMDGLFHCHKGEDSSCTMATTANFMLNATMPFYPAEGGATGAMLLLSQDPCNDPYHRNLCCGLQRSGTICSNWTGAHLVSRGCILYGSLTAEMSIRMPRGSNPFWDVGTYVYGGTPDPTWNELDMIFQTRSANATSAQSSFDTFITTTFSTSFFNPVEHRQEYGPSSYPQYNGYTANEYHNYTLEWTPTFIAWSVDQVVYWNQTRLGDCFTRRCAHHVRSITHETLIPWRPQTIRLILRTADSTSYPQPNVHVFLRRLEYVPMPPTRALQRREHSLLLLMERLAVGVAACVFVVCLLRALADTFRALRKMDRDDAPQEDWVVDSLLGAGREWAKHNWDLPGEHAWPSDARVIAHDKDRLRAAMAAAAANGVLGAEQLPLLGDAAGQHEAAEGAAAVSEDSHSAEPRKGRSGREADRSPSRRRREGLGGDDEGYTQPRVPPRVRAAPAPLPHIPPAAHALPPRLDAPPRRKLRGMRWTEQQGEEPGDGDGGAAGGANPPPAAGLRNAWGLFRGAPARRRLPDL